MICIKTERLSIRHVVRDDWKSIQKIWADFHDLPYHWYDSPTSIDDKQVRREIRKWAKENRGCKHMFFVVCLEDTVIGYIVFHRITEGYDFGYCFHCAYHKKGYAKESMLALFDYMRSLGVKKLTAGTALKNTPSVALLKSLGFSMTQTEEVSFYEDADGNDIVFEGGVFELDL